MAEYDVLTVGATTQLLQQFANQVDQQTGEKLQQINNTATNFTGWIALFSNITDGDRIVQRLEDYYGGVGPKPSIYAGGTTRKYLGASGFVTDIAQATNIRGLPGLKGDQGNKGWTAITANIVDGARVVQQVIDWTGGEGTKPATGQYIGSTGLVSLIANATDIRGATGLTGNKGWSPVISNVTDGSRVVQQVTDWTGGEGTKPAVSPALYVSPTGFTSVIANATDIRGSKGDKGDTGDTGPVGLNLRGAWQANTDYVLRDAVESGGSSYYCITPHTSGSSFLVGSNWKLYAQGGSVADGAVTEAKLDATATAKLNATDKLSFKNSAALTASNFTGFPNAIGTILFGNSQLVAKATDNTKYYTVINDAEVAQAIISNITNYIIVGKSATETFFFAVAGSFTGRLFKVPTGDGSSFTQIATLSGFTALPAGYKIKIVFSATTISLFSSADGITWSAFGSITKAAYGITGNRVGTINRSTITEDVYITGVVLADKAIKTEFDSATIDNATKLDYSATEYIPVLDPAYPAGVKKVPATALPLAGNLLKYSQEPAIAWQWGVQPNGNFSYTYSNSVLAVRTTVFTGDTPWASVINDADLTQAELSFSGLTRSYIVVGAKNAAGVITTFFISTGAASVSVYEINTAGQYIGRGSVASATGAAMLSGAQVKLVWDATTVKVYQKTTGDYTLWVTLTKATYGINMNRTGAMGGSQNSASAREMDVRIVSYTHAVSIPGVTTDLTTVPELSLLNSIPHLQVLSSALLGGVGKIAPAVLKVLLSSKWIGKTIVLFGDSLSSTDYTWYATQLAAKTGATVIAKGYSGNNVAQTCDNAKLDSVVALNPDLVICLFGGNDDGAAGSVGTFTGASGETVVSDPNIAATYAGTKYIEAVAYMMRYLSSKLYDFRTGNTAPYTNVRKPKLAICNGLPQKRNSNSLTGNWNSPDNWLRKVNAVEEVASRYHIPVVDTYRNVGLDMYIEPYWTSPTDKVNSNGVYTMDGLHLNEFGNDRMTDVIVGRINNI